MKKHCKRGPVLTSDPTVSISSRSPTSRAFRSVSLYIVVFLGSQDNQTIGRTSRLTLQIHPQIPPTNRLPQASRLTSLRREEIDRLVAPRKGRKGFGDSVSADLEGEGTHGPAFLHIVQSTLILRPKSSGARHVILTHIATCATVAGGVFRRKTCSLSLARVCQVIIGISGVTIRYSQHEVPILM